MLQTFKKSVESIRESYQKDIVEPIFELDAAINQAVNNVETQNSIIDLYDEILDLTPNNQLKPERVSDGKDIFGDLYRNISVQSIPSHLKSYFEQYIRYIKESSPLFTTNEKTPRVLIEYSYDDDKNIIHQAYGINPMSRQYHSKELKKTMYLDFDLIKNKLGIDKDISLNMEKDLRNWEEFSKYLGSLKPGEVPQKPEWMSSGQWNEIKEMAMREAWEDQEAFNREMVKELPPEVGEVIWEQIKRNYLASKSKTEDAE